VVREGAGGAARFRSAYSLGVGLAAQRDRPALVFPYGHAQLLADCSFGRARRLRGEREAAKAPGGTVSSR
jgi:hypothetical protein